MCSTVSRWPTITSSTLSAMRATVSLAAAMSGGSLSRLSPSVVVSASASVIVGVVKRLTTL